MKPKEKRAVYSQLNKLWKTDSEFIKERKDDWRRVHTVFDGYRRADKAELKNIFLTGEGQSDYVNSRMYITPWRNFEDLKLFLQVSFRCGDSTKFVYSILKRQCIPNNNPNIPPEYILRDSQAEAIETVLRETEFLIGENKALFDGMKTEFDYKSYIKDYERLLYSFLTDSSKPLYYGFDIAFEVYKNAVSYYEENGVDIEHDKDIHKLIFLIYHYSPIQYSDENRYVALNLVLNIKHWLDSDCPEVFISTKEKADSKQVVEIGKSCDTKTLEDSNTTVFSKDQGLAPFFIFGSDFFGLFSSFYKSLKEMDICSNLIVDEPEEVDLINEFDIKFTKKTGIFDNGRVPAYKITLSPILTFDIKVNKEGKGVWFDLYYFISPSLNEDLDIGQVLAYVVPRLNSHYEKYYLNFPLIQFREAVKICFSNASEYKIGIPLSTSKVSKDIINFNCNAFCKDHYASRLEWNIEGAKENQNSISNMNDFSKFKLELASFS